MLNPFLESEISSEALDKGDLPRLGVPSRFLPACGADEYDEHATRALRTSQERSAPWCTYDGTAATTVVYVGVDADRAACAWFTAVLVGCRGEDTVVRRVAGPPLSLVRLDVGRVVPVDVVQHLYHPTSPLNGVRPSAGSDDISGVGIGVGVLAILGIPSARYLSMHFPRVALCVRRRAIEGLPTVLAFGSNDADEIQAAIPGVHLLVVEK